MYQWAGSFHFEVFVWVSVCKCLQTVLLNRVLGDDILPPLLVTFGLPVVIQNALLEGFSADSRKLPVGPIEAESVYLGTMNIGVMPLITFASAILCGARIGAIIARAAAKSGGVSARHTKSIPSKSSKCAGSSECSS